MESEPKKTNWWGIGGIIGLGLVIASGFASEPTTAPVNKTTTPSVVETKVVKPVDTSAFQQRTITNTNKIPTTVDTSDGLSNDNYYTNVDGNAVHAPAYSLDGDVPAGASARCNDGTYSFSQNRRGTCSRHGGVAEWL